MKKQIWPSAMLFSACILFASCDFFDPAGNSQIMSHQSSSTTESFSAPGTQSEETQSEVELAHDILKSYLNDCWGYRENTHQLFFDTTIALHDVEFLSFKVCSVKGEYENTFAISVETKKVYLFDTVASEWVEDKNPEPWPGW